MEVGLIGLVAPLPGKNYAKLCQKLCCAQHTNVLFNVRPVVSCEFILVLVLVLGSLGD